jgi:hypothetical protein
MSNYSPLQHNTLAGMSETAGILYLKLCEKYQAHKSPAYERRAFFDACKFEEKCAGVFDHILHRYEGFAHIPADVKTSLADFMAGRWLNNFMEAV